jgi:xanthine/CO dehydrogenase XdhC/CoxF family maturation factor
LEAEIIKRGPWLTRRGPVVKVYDSSIEEDEPAGHGCGGKVSILIEPVTLLVEDCFVRVADELMDERRVALITVSESSRSSLPIGTYLCGAEQRERDLSPSLSGAAQRLGQQLLNQADCILTEGNHRPSNVQLEDVKALVQVVQPAPHLFIFGAGEDAVPVAQFAKLLGWSVSICTRPGRNSTRDRFLGKARLLEMSAAEAAAIAERCSRPLALVMAHDFEIDKHNLGVLLESNVSYIGVLGPSQRTERMLAELRGDGQHISTADLQRLHGPAGLRLGGETPAEIALSILAEAQALIARTEVVPLRECVEAIHTLPIREWPLAQAGAV